MKMKIKGKIIAAVLAAAVALTGCAGNAPDAGLKSGTDTQQQDIIQQSMLGRKENFGALLVSSGIELPVSVTKIFVNQVGYISDRDKKVMFLGEQHGDKFRVVRQSDKKIVYMGSIEKGKVDKLSGVYLSAGDFTPVNEPGVYYIETDIVGQSYPFSISQDGYENLFVGMIKNAKEVQLTESAEGIIDTSFGIHVLMYALQCNGTLFEEAYNYLNEDEKDKQLVTQLLYLASWMMQQQGADGSLYGDYRATAAFCGALVMSRDVFGKYESSVSNEQKAAYDKAWKWLQKQKCETDDEKMARFYAAAQFFKVEDDADCKKMAEEFLRERKADYYGDRFVFYGVLSYVSAGESTNRELCNQIMMDLVDKNETACKAAKSDALFGTGRRTFYENFRYLLLLCFVNYVTPSKEYTEIVENTIQYMGGLNENGICYIDASGAWRELSETAGRNLEWNGILLFGMSDMLKNFIDIENSEK